MSGVDLQPILDLIEDKVEEIRDLPAEPERESQRTSAIEALEAASALLTSRFQEMAPHCMVVFKLPTE